MPPSRAGSLRLDQARAPELAPWPALLGRDHPLAQTAAAAYLGVPASVGVPILAGAVAQLGERVNGIHEVSGSIPLGSTYEIKSLDRSTELLGFWGNLRVTTRVAVVSC